MPREICRRCTPGTRHKPDAPAREGRHHFPRWRVGLVSPFPGAFGKACTAAILVAYVALLPHARGRFSESGLNTATSLAFKNRWFTIDVGDIGGLERCSGLRC